MTRHSLLLILFLGACGPSPPPRQPIAAPVFGNAFQAAILEGHNRERAAMGLAPLHWSPALEAAAAQFARQLASRGRLEHSPRAARPGQGENLWMGTRGAYSPAQMIASWTSEKSRFRPGIFPAVSRTGNWADAGHYSQMIWPATTQLGCGMARSAGHDFLVCRYAPAGNIDGRRVP